MKLARLTALVLLAFLIAAGSAFAAEEAETTVPAFAGSEAQLAQELEWEEEGEEECVEGDDESSFEEFCEEAADEENGEAEAEECPLRSTSTHASVAHDRLKITIGYTTYRPAAATIKISKLGTFERHLGRSGVLRFTEKKSAKHGKRVVVHIRVPSARRYCADEAAVLFK